MELIQNEMQYILACLEADEEGEQAAVFGVDVRALRRKLDEELEKFLPPGFYRNSGEKGGG